MNRLSTGPNLECYADSSMRASGEISIGRFTYICEDALLVGHSPISIGSFCSIAAGFHCVTHEQHPTMYATTFPLRDILGVATSHGGVIGLDGQKRVTKPMPVSIGNDVWIGDGATVFGGVTIGHGCVIGAKSLVTKDCVPYGIYAGTPARLIRTRFPDDVISQLLGLNWWDWSIEKIRRNALFFETDFREYTGAIADLLAPQDRLLTA